jgi:hypothetical protein
MNFTQMVDRNNSIVDYTSQKKQANDGVFLAPKSFNLRKMSKIPEVVETNQLPPIMAVTPVIPFPM